MGLASSYSLHDSGYPLCDSSYPLRGSIFHLFARESLRCKRGKPQD